MRESQSAARRLSTRWWSCCGRPCFLRSMTQSDEEDLIQLAARGPPSVAANRAERITREPQATGLNLTVADVESAARDGRDGICVSGVARTVPHRLVHAHRPASLDQ